MAHSLSSLQELIDKKFSTDSFTFPYNETQDADITFSKQSKEYPITDENFSTTALEPSYSEGEASDADVSVSDEVQNNAKSIVDSNASKHGSLRYILEYISKPRRRVQQYVPPSNSHSEIKKSLDSVRHPVSLIGRRQRPTFAGYDLANISIDDLRRENEEINQRLICIICCTNLRNVVFIPCGHLVVCSGCKHDVGQQCPMCRGKIFDKIECLYT